MRQKVNCEILFLKSFFSLLCTQKSKAEREKKNKRPDPMLRLFSLIVVSVCFIVKPLDSMDFFYNGDDRWWC